MMRNEGKGVIVSHLDFYTLLPYLHGSPHHLR